MTMNSIMECIRHSRRTRLVMKGRAVALIREAVMPPIRVIPRLIVAMIALSLFVRTVIIRL